MSTKKIYPPKQLGHHNFATAHTKTKDRVTITKKEEEDVNVG